MKAKVSFDYNLSTNYHISTTARGAGGRYEMSIITTGDDRHLEIFNPTLFVAKGAIPVFELPLKEVLKGWIKDELAAHTIPNRCDASENPLAERERARTSPVVFDHLANRWMYGETIDHIVALLNELKAFANSLRYDDQRKPRAIAHSESTGAQFALDIHDQTGSPELAASFLRSLPVKPASDASTIAWRRYNADCERIARAYVEMARWRFEYRQAVDQANKPEPLQ